MQYLYAVESRRLFIPPRDRNENFLKNRIQLEISGVKLLRWTEGSETHLGSSYREDLKIDALILVAKLIITENNIGVFSFKLF